MGKKEQEFEEFQRFQEFRRKEGERKKESFVRWIIVIVIVAVLMVGGTLFFLNKIGALINPWKKEDSPGIFGQSSTSKITQISHELRAAGELVTEEYEYSDLLELRYTPTLVGWLEDHTGMNLDSTLINNYMWIQYNGVIKAGYDFSQIGLEMDEEEMVLYITLPEPMIISNEITDVNYEKSEGIFMHIDAGSELDEVMEAKEAKEQQAVEYGLYQRAEDSAIEQIKGMVNQIVDLDGYALHIIRTGDK